MPPNPNKVVRPFKNHMEEKALRGNVVSLGGGEKP